MDTIKHTYKNEEYTVPAPITGLTQITDQAEYLQFAERMIELGLHKNEGGLNILAVLPAATLDSQLRDLEKARETIQKAAEIQVSDKYNTLKQVLKKQDALYEDARVLIPEWLEGQEMTEEQRNQFIEQVFYLMRFFRMACQWSQNAVQLDSLVTNDMTAKVAIEKGFVKFHRNTLKGVSHTAQLLSTIVSELTSYGVPKESLVTRKLSDFSFAKVGGVKGIKAGTGIKDILRAKDLVAGNEKKETKPKTNRRGRSTKKAS